MAAPYRIVWLLLPQGIVAGRAQFSALAQFRLMPPTPATLAGFPTLLDWPTLVDKTSFSLTLGGSSNPISLLKAPTTPTAAASAWWKALFPSTTPVRPFAQDVLPPVVTGYDLAAAAKQIADLYNGFFEAAPGGVLPSYAVAAQKIEIALRTGDGKPGGSFGQLNAWRAQLSPGHGKMPTDPAAVTQGIDFHQRVSSLDSIAELMRHLRIAVPLSCDLAALPTASIFTAGVAATPDANPQPNKAANPQTRIDRTVMLPAGGTLARAGWLLAAPASLIAVDAEGAMIKLDGLVASAKGIAASDANATGAVLAGGATDGTAAPAGMPALRVQGLALALAGQREATLAAAAKAAALAADESAGKAVVLDADTLSTAWRIDIQDQGPLAAPDAGRPFRSLHLRRTDVALGALKLPTFDDEGAAVEAGTQQGVGDSVQQTMSVPPALAIWKGWSLSVPSPWAVVAPEPKAGKTEMAKVENAPIGSIPIDIDFPAARALPQLRYGRVYAARARAVDASGWSLAVSSPAPAAAVVAPVPFLRLDPVPPPTLAFIVGSAFPGAAATADGVEGPQSGESAERLAIRTLSTDPAGTVRRSRRLALPARTTFETAERHGMLDGRPAPELFKLLVERDRTGTDGEPLWIEKRNVALEYVPVGSGIVPFAPAVPTPPGVDKPEAPLQGVGTPGAPLPYLPDPLARKVRAWLVPISKTGPIGALAGRWPSFRPNNAVWEAARPFVVMLESGATGIRVEPGAAFDTLVVSLAPGEAAALHLAGVIDDAATARLFQIVQWAIDRGVGVNEAIRRVTDAAHWLVTPWRRVECVHAVDKPLTLPVITLSTPRMSRKPDSRHVELAFTTPLDLNSTGRLELLADWFEPSRDAAVAGSPPVVLAQAGRAFNTSIARDAVTGPASKVTLPVSGSHALAGTGYARIAYRAVASSRFREYMAPDLRNETPATPDLSKMAVTSAARSAFAPASSSPPAPVLGPIVPAFKWQRTAEGLVRTSRRIARTLRIDLGSRWFESGFNEMLAVLVPSPMLKVQASEIADDPLFPSVAPLPLAPAAFPLRRVSPSQGPIPDWYFASDGGKQHLAELNACPVAVFGDGAVVPHLVDYDQATGRFFADIAVSTKGFRPLVRLVLARYQPVVVPGCNTLSQSVSTDFLPLLPDRAAVLHTILTPWLTGESWGIRLLGPMIDGNGVRHRLRCTTQQLRPQASADFGWQPVDPVGQSVKFGMKPGTTPVAPPIPAGVADLPLIADGVAFVGNRTAGFRYRVLVEEFVSLPAALPGTGETEQRIFFETFDL